MTILMEKIMLKKLISLSILMLTTLSTAYAVEGNFNCPQPAEIQSTDFTAPSIWTAPPVSHSASGVIGVGLGGKIVKEFIGSQAADVNNKKGWVCVYKTEGGLSVREYQSKILNIQANNRYLRKYFDKMNKEFENAEPYLKKFPQDIPLGFVGYQKK